VPIVAKPVGKYFCKIWFHIPKLIELPFRHSACFISYIFVAHFSTFRETNFVSENIFLESYIDYRFPKSSVFRVGWYSSDSHLLCKILSVLLSFCLPVCWSCNYFFIHYFLLPIFPYLYNICFPVLSIYSIMFPHVFLSVQYFLSGSLRLFV
jgi:hypothetical protein